MISDTLSVNHSVETAPPISWKQELVNSTLLGVDFDARTRRLEEQAINASCSTSEEIDIQNPYQWKECTLRFRRLDASVTSPCDIRVIIWSHLGAGDAQIRRAEHETDPLDNPRGAH